MRIPSWLIACALALPGAAPAESVTLDHQGVALTAELSLAPGKTLAQGVVVLLHGTTAHHRMEIITALEQSLHERGFNTLAVNLGYGIGARTGMLPCEVKHVHRHEDAVAELDQWLKWLRQKGVGRVWLVGHSRGGNQVLWYAQEHPAAGFDKIVAIAPMAFDADDEAKAFASRYQRPLAPLLADAEKRVKQGNGDALLEGVPFLYCEKASVAAKSFVSYHGGDPRKHTPNLLAKVDEPVLVILGGDDPLSAKVKPGVARLKGKPNVSVKTIDGADHFFRDLYAEDAAELIAAFLRQ